jgi:hypothetical protein
MNSHREHIAAAVFYRDVCKYLLLLFCGVDMAVYNRWCLRPTQRLFWMVTGLKLDCAGC